MTEILDDSAVSEIEARITSGDSQVMYETANVDNVRALCATVKHLRAERDALQKGLKERCQCGQQDTCSFCVIQQEAKP